MTTIKDERILAERQAIQSRAYTGVIYALALSILVQQFFLHAPFAQYAVEFFILLGCGLHNLISGYSRGLNLWSMSGATWKRTLAQMLLTGALSVLLLVLFGGERNAENLVFFFITFVTFSFILRLLIDAATRRKQRAIDRELGEDEDA